MTVLAWEAAIVAFLFLLMPPSIGRAADPMGSLSPGLRALAGAGMIIGLVWMWRIARAPTNPEDARHWRYQDR